MDMADQNYVPHPCRRLLGPGASASIIPLQLLKNALSSLHRLSREACENLEPAFRRLPEAGQSVLQSRLANRMWRDAERLGYVGGRDLLPKNVEADRDARTQSPLSSLLSTPGESLTLSAVENLTPGVGGESESSRWVSTTVALRMFALYRELEQPA
jgi:hypothetical protein